MSSGALAPYEATERIADLEGDLGEGIAGTWTPEQTERSEARRGLLPGRRR